MQPGKLVTIANKKYKIEHELGSGVTALVYQAQPLEGSDLVAIKQARPNLDKLGEAYIAAFNSEWEILTDFNTAYQNTYSTYQQCVPKPIGFKRDNFIVQSLARGLPLARWLQQQIIQGKPPPEATVLEISRQLAELLVVLHEGLQHSYTDFQMKNIYWDPDDEPHKGQLTVIDWNHVDTGEKFKPQADIYRLGTFMYRMLTGRVLEDKVVNWSEQPVEINPVARFLTEQALLAGEDDRINARGLLSGLKAAQQELIALREDVAQLIKHNPSPTGLDYASLIKVDVFVVRQQQTDDIDNATKLWLEVITDWQSKADVEDKTAQAEIENKELQFGVEDFKVGEYSQAVDKFRQAANESSSLSVWRWFYVAEAVKQHSITISPEEIIQLIKALQTEQYDQVGSRMAELSAPAQNYLACLRYEAEIVLKLPDLLAKTDQTGLSIAEYKEIEREYQSIAEKLDEFPAEYRQAFKTTHNWPDLSQKQIALTESIQQAEAINEAVTDIRSRLAQSSIDEAIKQLWQLFTEKPAAHFELLKLCVEQVRNFLQWGQPDIALKIIEVALVEVVVPDASEKGETLAQNVAKLRSLGEQAFNLLDFSKSLGSDYEIAGQLIQKLGSPPSDERRGLVIGYLKAMAIALPSITPAGFNEFEFYSLFESLRGICQSGDPAPIIDEILEQFTRKREELFQRITDPQNMPKTITQARQNLTVLQAISQSAKLSVRDQGQEEKTKNGLKKILATYEKMESVKPFNDLSSQMIDEKVGYLKQLNQLGVTGKDEPGDLTSLFDIGNKLAEKLIAEFQAILNCLNETRSAVEVEKCFKQWNNLKETRDYYEDHLRPSTGYWSSQTEVRQKYQETREKLVDLYNKYSQNSYGINSLLSSQLPSTGSEALDKLNGLVNLRKAACSVLDDLPNHQLALQRKAETETKLADAKTEFLARLEEIDQDLNKARSVEALSNCWATYEKLQQLPLLSEAVAYWKEEDTELKNVLDKWKNRYQKREQLAQHLTDLYREVQTTRESTDWAKLVKLHRLAEAVLAILPEHGMSRGLLDKVVRPELTVIKQELSVCLEKISNYCAACGQDQWQLTLQKLREDLALPLSPENPETGQQT